MTIFGYLMGPLGETNLSMSGVRCRILPLT